MLEVASISGIPVELARALDLSWADVGNAMHVASVGIVTSVVLACTTDSRSGDTPKCAKGMP